MTAPATIPSQIYFGDYLQCSFCLGTYPPGEPHDCDHPITPYAIGRAHAEYADPFKFSSPTVYTVDPKEQADFRKGIDDWRDEEEIIEKLGITHAEFYFQKSCPACGKLPGMCECQPVLFGLTEVE